MELQTRARILVSGLVQGVLFRKNVMDLARMLGITGWVRNLQDGRVEVLAEGEKGSIDQLIRFCRVGPPGARVKSVDVEWSGHAGEFRSFRIVHLGSTLARD